MKEGDLLIYGCYGFTGKLIAEYAVKCGLKPILAGRDERKIKLLSNRLQLPYRVFDLVDHQNIVENIKDIKIVLNCAGPFIHTAHIMARACLQAKTHYLDIAGEYEVFEKLYSLNADAEQAGILIMPGVGFDVVPTDCLALHLKKKLPTANSLQIALLLINGRLSPGTATTIAGNIFSGTALRRNGEIEKVLHGEINRMIDLGQHRYYSTAIPWGDISSACRSTGIPNISIFLCVPRMAVGIMKLANHTVFIQRSEMIKKILTWLLQKFPLGQSVNTKSGSIVWGEVKNAKGEFYRAKIQLPDTYDLTARTSVKIVQEILNKKTVRGSKTPAQLFGSDFILLFKGVVREDIV